MQQAKSVILAQNLLRLVLSNLLTRLFVVVVLPFVGVMAAFGIAPNTIVDQPALSKVIEDLTLPGLATTADVDEGYWREERIQRGDTVAALLSRLQVNDPEAEVALRITRETKVFRQLIPGRTIRAKTTADGRLHALQYLNNNSVFSAERGPDGITVLEQPAELELRTQMQSGVIRSSLFAATDAINLSDAVAIQVAEIFSTDIDFHRDLRKGDRFTVVYEIFYHLGTAVKSGRVLAAEFINQGKTYQAVYFQNADGQGGYYTFDGKNIRKAFLRSPIEFSRISSGFSNARFHPVLKQWRAHKGIDYAAGTGTRVRATSDGVVETAGVQGGYGNLVVLRHQSKYTTWYGHLSGFAKGIRRGGRVSQGDVIGYVGATGLATGPHLHYEFRINDVHQNPLQVVMPSAPPITTVQKPEFEAATQPLAQRLTLLRGINTARFD
jgi:murein DD-endopeptidase MepM/ murein hydrolase activator NlpD